MEKLIKVLAKGEIVTPSKFGMFPPPDPFVRRWWLIVDAIEIKLPLSPTDSEINIDPELLTPVNTHTTRSKSITATVKPLPKTKSKSKPKTNDKAKGNSKVVAKSTKSKLHIKSTNIPSPSPSPKSRIKSKSESSSGSGVQENTPIKSIAELIKEGKRGRGKKRV